jgi:hypothetical protein
MMQVIQFRLRMIQNYELKGCGRKRKFRGTKGNHKILTKKVVFERRFESRTYRYEVELLNNQLRCHTFRSYSNKLERLIVNGYYFVQVANSSAMQTINEQQSS